MSNSVYTESEFHEFLIKAFGSVKRMSSDYQVTCPFCKEKKGHDYSKKKLAIKKGSVHVSHCWVCGFRSRNIIAPLKKASPNLVKIYIKKFLDSESLYKASENKKEEIKSVTLPDGFTLLTPDSTGRYQRSLLRYLAARQIDLKEDLWYWRIGYCEYENKPFRSRVVLPSLDENGNLNYWTARHIHGAFPKYRNPDIERESIVFNEINIDWTKPLLITEGPFDILKCPKNSTCLLGSALNEDYKLFHKIIEHDTEIILALDADAKEKEVRIARLLMSYGISVKVLDIPKGHFDLGDMSRTQINKALQTNVYAIDSKSSLLEVRLERFRSKLLA